MQDVSKGEGRTVLFVSHNMNAIKSLCKTGVLIDKGRVVYSGNASDTVREYLSSKLSSYIDYKEPDAKSRKFYVSKDLEILSTRLLSPVEMAQDEPIEVELEIKRNNTSIKNFTIEMMIEDIEEKNVGSFISQVYETPDKELFKIRLSVPDHNLARGKYSLDFNIGLKDDNEYGFKDFDVVYDMLMFEVMYIDHVSKRPIQVWRDEWGVLHSERFYLY